MQEAQVERHEGLLAVGDPRQIEALWQRVHDRVFMQAIPRVPWKDDADAWYGPNAAVWTVLDPQQTKLLASTPRGTFAHRASKVSSAADFLPVMWGTDFVLRESNCGTPPRGR